MLQSAASDPLGLVGKLLERKYRIDARVAEGGFGVVYAGQHIALMRPLAIKVLKRAPEVSPAAWGDLIGQFLEEARLVARLRHPAVVAVIDAGVTSLEGHIEGVPWIVMEWLDGETLADNLARRRAHGQPGRTRAETFALLRPVVEAVAEAHEAGIVHRDLNPNNLMLVPGRPATSARVLDFGIAKVMRPDAGAHAMTSVTTTDLTMRAVSIAYAAPEQLSGARTGPWTDVHALGLLITDVLCGGRVIPDDVDAHYRAAFDPTRPTPGSLGVDAGDWEPILARALALSACDRYASAGALLAALDSATPGALRSTPPRRRRRTAAPPAPSEARDGLARVRGRPGRIAALIAVAIVLAAAAAMRWYLDRGGGAAGVAAPVAARAAAPVAGRDTNGCTSNAACARPGSPAICRPGVGCVALRSPDCEPLADPRALGSDATVWFGAMFPRSGPDARAFGDANVNAVELARRDFAQVMSGTSAGGTLERARPFGVVVCDDAIDPRRAANHLVNLGVPAVIGFYTSVEAIDLTTSLFLPNRILAIAALNANPLVTNVPHPDGAPRLVWRTTYSSAAAATALAAWIDGELEPSLRRGGRELGHGAMRVALLRPRGAAGQALSDAFSKTLRFNGKSALDNGASYRELTFEAEAPKTSPEYAAMTRELLAFSPHVVLHAGNAAIVEALFAPLEAAWPAGAPLRPRYAGVAPIPNEVLAFIGANKERRGRFFGVTPVSSTVANARFVTHYNAVFPDKVTLTLDPNTSYDAFYLLAYATYAIPSAEAVTGERLSHAFGRLVAPGRRIEVGLSGIFDAYAALSKDGSIALVGATGKLDLDPSTGEPAFDLAILCVGVDAHDRASDGIESGLVYSATSRKLEGTMRCP
jgi:ABC-type branched-subunit amino acid transport system substrate-binding protein